MVMSMHAHGEHLGLSSTTVSALSDEHAHASWKRRTTTWRPRDREAGWRLENISEDKYEIPPKAAEMAQQFARGYGLAMVATAIRI